MNHILLHLLLPQLRQNFIGSRITGATWMDPVLSIAFSLRETRYLIAILSNPGPFCFVAPDDPIAGCGAEPAFEEAVGTRLTEVSIPFANRVLGLQLSGRRGLLSLSLVMRGGSGGAILTHNTNVLSSVGSRVLRHRLKIDTPKTIRPLAHIKEPELAALLETGLFLLDSVPGLEPELVTAFTLPSGKCDTSSLLNFRDGILQGSLPFFLYTPGRLSRAFPLPDPPAVPPEQSVILGSFQNGATACKTVGERLMQTAFETIIEKRLKPIVKRLTSRKALRHRLIEELREAEKHPKLRKETEALAAYRTRVPPGASTVVLPDPYEPKVSLTIELAPAVPIHVQIEKRFKKAAKLERSVQKVSKRLREIDKELRSLENVISTAKNSQSHSEVLQYLDRTLLKIGFPAGAGHPRAVEEHKKSYRRYNLDAVWFVLVGRNNRENDEITFRIAGADDWWFHAQGVPGSHVILKSKGSKDNPPAKVLNAAAGIAAYYSKSRSASLVPVIYTRRKYVRKPRKASPGKVRCEREKTIFVEPSIPDAPDAPSKNG